MIQPLKLGLRFSSIACSCKVNYRLPKFAASFASNSIMPPKRRRSASSAFAAGNLDDAVGGDALKPPDNALASARGKGVIEENKANPKTKGKGLSGRGAIQITNSSSEISRVKREKKRVNQPSEDATQAESVEGTLEKEDLIIKSSEVEVEKSLRAAKRVSSRMATSNSKASVNAGVLECEPWTVLAHKKPQKEWVAYNPKTMRPPPLAADTSPHMKLMSWNVNGLRALLKLESFSALELARRENIDVLCLQETKLQEKDVEAIRHSLLEGYDNSYWTCSVSKLGYSGTAIISRIKPHSVRYGLGLSDHDSEGRLVTLEFDSFYLLCSYVPNSGDGLRRLSYRINQWDPSLSNYMKDLEKSKPVILTGDLNCAHQEIDIFNPTGNRRSAGFTDEERDSFQKNFLDRGFVDTFRKQHPNVVGYTYWGYRHGGRKSNKGWRLDYFLASESIADQVYDSYILPDVGGSDHSPIGLILKRLTTAIPVSAADKVSETAPSSTMHETPDSN